MPVVEDDNVERALVEIFDGIEEGRVAGLRDGGGRSEEGRGKNDGQQDEASIWKHATLSMAPRNAAGNNSGQDHAGSAL